MQDRHPSQAEPSLREKEQTDRGPKKTNWSSNESEEQEVQILDRSK